MVLCQYGAVRVDIWYYCTVLLRYLVSLTWYWVRITLYRLVLSGTGLVQGFYACIYWKKVKPWLDVTIAGQTNDQTRKDRATQPMDHGRQKAQPDILSPESLVRLNNSLPLREFEDVRTLPLCKDDTNGKTWRLKVSSFQERGNGPDFHLTFWNFATLQSVVCQSVQAKPMKIFKFMFHFVIAENGASIQHVTFFCNLLLIPAIEEFKYPEKGHKIGCF